MSSISTYKGQFIKDPPFVYWLLNSPRAAWIWLVLRVWLGYQWIDASLHKIDFQPGLKLGMP